VAASSSPILPEKPLLLLIEGETEITAGGAIVVEQVVGNLEVGVISSPATVELLAPFGSIVQSSLGGSGGEGDWALRGVVGPTVSIQALIGIGSADNNLIVTTDNLTAIASLNNLDLLHQSHSENLSEIATLIAGGVIRLRTSSDVMVTGSVIGQAAQFHSYHAGKSIQLSLSDLQHILGGSLGIVLGGFESLHLDDTIALLATAIQVGGGKVDTRTAKITTEAWLG
jgi:hypothetical protein